MHYYKCPKLNNRVKLMLMNKKLNNYLFMLFLVYILICIHLNMYCYSFLSYVTKTFKKIKK